MPLRRVRLNQGLDGGDCRALARADAANGGKMIAQLRAHPAARPVWGGA